MPLINLMKQDDILVQYYSRTSFCTTNNNSVEVVYLQIEEKACHLYS